MIKIAHVTPSGVCKLRVPTGGGPGDSPIQLELIDLFDFAYSIHSSFVELIFESSVFEDRQNVGNDRWEMFGLQAPLRSSLSIVVLFGARKLSQSKVEKVVCGETEFNHELLVTQSLTVITWKKAKYFFTRQQSQLPCIYPSQILMCAYAFSGAKRVTNKDEILEMRHSPRCCEARYIFFVRISTLCENFLCHYKFQPRGQNKDEIRNSALPPR